MSREVVQREIVLHPTTGEVLDLASASTDDLGRFLYEVRDFESRLKEAKGLASREVLRRQDMSAEWTTRASNYVLKGASPAAGHKEEFNGEALYNELWQLEAEGLISAEAIEAAVDPEVVYTTKKAGITKLRKIGGKVADAVNHHATSAEKPRYVNVEKIG